MTKQIIATLFLVLAVAGAQHAFDTDETFDVTSKAGHLAKIAESAAAHTLKQGAGFLVKRDGKDWLNEKVQTEEMWKKSREIAFSSVDQDKDGILEGAEQVIDALLKHTRTKNAEMLVNAADLLEPCKEEAGCAEAVMQRVDANADGKVTEAEFNHYIQDGMTEQLRETKKRANLKVLKNLKGADANKDGIISREEYDKLLAERDFPQSAVPPRYETLDTNHDGKVTTLEFSRLLLKQVGKAEESPESGTLFQVAGHAMDYGAKFLEEGSRMRTGLWNSYAQKRLAEKQAQTANDGGKVN